MTLFNTNIKAAAKRILSLSEHLDLEASEAAIRKNIYFRGPNVIILACAIVIAAVGLNVNSTAVIIGAMLISPVMGPIIGFGFSLGTNDTELLKKSLHNFVIMVGISILASALFFIISPLTLENPTELLARTTPTIYDVLIALFGGLAGMLENSRKDKGVVLSGVAIATALMPPLCTVGYGIATLSAKYIFGALYLFIINSVFIALATFITTKYLGYKSHHVDNPSLNKHSSRIVALIIVALIVPSIITATSVIRQNNFNISAERFVSKNKTMGPSYIYDYKINTESKPYYVELFVAGEKLDTALIDMLYKSADHYGLEKNQVKIRDEATIKGDTSTEVFRDLYEYYDRRIQELNQTITELRIELAKYKNAAAKDSARVAARDSVVNADSSEVNSSN